MESENTVTYFLFNDRKSTLGCSFILICSLTFFELYSCFIYISPLLYPKYNTIPFYLLSLSFSNHPYFTANPPPIRLHFTLLHLNILPYINKKTFAISILFLPYSSSSPIFSTFILTSFSFSNHLHPLSFIPISIPIKILFSTPPQSLCSKGMATLSCNSNDIASQKQCNCHLKALLLERKSYSFTPQRLCPRQTGA